MKHQSLPPRVRAFTLVELLVVIAIIGILMSMTLPAIQSARESGRRTQCRNNIKNQASAALQHVAQQGFFPTGGWGYTYVGDADRGFSRRQPGGWQYNILPYMEETQLHDLGKGLAEAGKKAAHSTRISTPIPVFNCPTRRRPEAFPGNYSGVNCNSTKLVARSDYAGNGGSEGYGGGGGPGSGALTAADADVDAMFPGGATAIALRQTSPMFARSEIKPAHIRDGDSKTYLLGERHIRFDTYDGSTPGDDDQGWGVGYDQDVMRVTAALPQQDTELVSPVVFGSAHIAAFNMAMADGSVKSVTYEIESAVHKSLGHRADGGPTNMSALTE
jgi:prepilin-type N-terminal cleavage/methylation domain-containing protein